MPSSAKVASAILAVYNAESTICPALDTLLTQSVPIEIIVVDDGSTDQTLSLLKKYSQIKLYTQSHAGPALARNLGASHATAPILLFVDADMTFDQNYVQDLIMPINAQKVIGTYTIQERVANWDNVWARCWNIQEGWEDKLRFPKNPPKYGTDFRAILKTEFERVGGFDNIGYTDTWSLFNKLNARPLATRAICYHKNPDTLTTVFYQSRWSAKRPYKLGLIGTLYALLRSSLPLSLVVGVVKALLFTTPAFFIFKIVYDLGRFIGIMEMITTGKLSK